MWIMCHEGISDLPVRLVVPPQPWKVAPPAVIQTRSGGATFTSHAGRRGMGCEMAAHAPLLPSTSVLSCCQAEHERPGDSRKEMEVSSVAESLREEQELRLRHEAYVKGRKKIK